MRRIKFWTVLILIMEGMLWMHHIIWLIHWWIKIRITIWLTLVWKILCMDSFQKEGRTLVTYKKEYLTKLFKIRIYLNRDLNRHLLKWIVLIGRIGQFQLIIRNRNWNSKASIRYQYFRIKIKNCQVLQIDLWFNQKTGQD